MARFLLVLLVVWVALAVIGAIVKGLLWLLVIGVVLFLATSALGLQRRRN